MLPGFVNGAMLINAGITAPFNTVLPAITGTPTSGQTLSVSDGTWTGDAPITYSYQWKADGTAISGATGSTYTLTDSEIGKVITCTVTATNAAGSASATSAATDAVAAAAPTDPHFANVVFLCGFDGTDGATSATDDSASAHAMTFNGSAQIDTAQSKFGGASLLIDGVSNSFVSSADSSDWFLGAGQFTIEAWFYLAGTAHAFNAIIGQWNTGGNDRAWWLEANSGRGLEFWYSTTGSDTPSVATATGIITLNEWHHVAVDRDASSKLRVYLDGVMKASGTVAATFRDSSYTMNIGRDSNTGREFVGSIDEVRITKAVARYASDAGFTAPTEAFPRS